MHNLCISTPCLLLLEGHYWQDDLFPTLRNRPVLRVCGAFLKSKAPRTEPASIVAFLIVPRTDIKPWRLRGRKPGRRPPSAAGRPDVPPGAQPRAAPDPPPGRALHAHLRVGRCPRLSAPAMKRAGLNRRNIMVPAKAASGHKHALAAGPTKVCSRVFFRQTHLRADPLESH